MAALPRTKLCSFSVEPFRSPLVNFPQSLHWRITWPLVLKLHPILPTTTARVEPRRKQRNSLLLLQNQTLSSLLFHLLLLSSLWDLLWVCSVTTCDSQSCTSCHHITVGWGQVVKVVVVGGSLHTTGAHYSCVCLSHPVCWLGVTLTAFPEVQNNFFSHPRHSRLSDRNELSNKETTSTHINRRQRQKVGLSAKQILTLLKNSEYLQCALEEWEC